MLHLSDDTLLETRAYIAGNWVDGKSTFSIKNPVDNVEICSVANTNVDDIQQAIQAAEDAQKGWASKTALERADLLMAWHDLMMAAQDDLAQIITAEMGKPLLEAKGEIAYGASFIRWFAEEARRMYGDIVPGHQPDKRLLILKQPIGVVASITPWNFPNAMIARKVAPALAAGCTFVARPAEKTPLSALAMAVLAEKAGIPASVFSVLPSSGDRASAVGKEMCRNSKVRKLTFTGSTNVGRILMEQCAHDIKKVSLELGGNAPFIVFDDADLDAAVEGVLIAKFRNIGQTCVCANRIYVQSGVYEDFTRKLVEALSHKKQGNGFDEDVVFGPLVSDQAVAKVRTHVADATELGAKIVVGGDISETLGGRFFEPTVMTGITSQMKVAREETFGPLAALIQFDAESEVIAAANDTEFGLASYFYTRDLSRTFRVGEALEYGIVGINTGLISTPEAPFGGVKSSGLGREGSKYGLEDFLEIKYLCIGVG